MKLFFLLQNFPPLYFLLVVYIWCVVYNYTYFFINICLVPEKDFDNWNKCQMCGLVILITSFLSHYYFRFLLVFVCVFVSSYICTNPNMWFDICSLRPSQVSNYLCFIYMFGSFYYEFLCCYSYLVLVF